MMPATSSAIRLADLALTWSNTTGDGDLSMIDQDLASDAGLETAVLLSLFLDRRARDDDQPPSGDPTDRRGWWGDEFAASEGDRIGSRLWLLDRSNITGETARLAEQYVREALQWMLDDLVASSLDVTIDTSKRDRMDIGVTLQRPGRETVSFRFAAAWDPIPTPIPAPVPAPPLPPLIVGGPEDSNGVGQDVGPDEWDETFAPMTAVPGVPWRFRFSQSSNDPIPYQTDITAGGVQPYNTAGVQNTGWRQTFAQEAVRAGFSCALAELGISGIAAKQCTPAAAFPASGPNVWNQVTAWADAAETALNVRTRATFNIIGGNDGFNSTDAGNCQANLTAIVNGAIAKWTPAIKMLMVRQPDFQGIASTLPFLSTIQAAQDAVAAAFPANVVQLLTADLKGHSDHLHYDGDSSAILGQRAFFALLDALGVARVRPATPQIVGWGPQYITISAADYNPIPPACGVPGDLELLFSITQSAGGSSTRITAPTVAGGGTAWTALNDAVLGDTQIQSTQTTTSRLGVWARAVTASRAVGGTPVTTVPSNGLTINGGRIVTVRGPNALTTANVGLVRYSKNDAFQTALTLLGGNVTGGVLAFAGGYRTNATSNPVTMSGGSVSGLARAFGGNRAAGPGGDFITNAAWNAIAAGATGDLTVAYALATLGVGALIGIAP